MSWAGITQICGWWKKPKPGPKRPAVTVSKSRTYGTWSAHRPRTIGDDGWPVTSDSLCLDKAGKLYWSDNTREGHWHSLRELLARLDMEGYKEVVIDLHYYNGDMMLLQGGFRGVMR